MKVIPLKKINEFDYREAVLGLLRNPPRKRGFSVEDVRLAVKGIEAVEASKTEVGLEDAVYNFLMNCLKDAEYTVAGKELVQFFDDLENAKEPAEKNTSEPK